MPLTATELERGWVEFHCSRHGFIAAGPTTASVTCRCGKRASEYRNGSRLSRPELLRIRASAKSLQTEGLDDAIRALSRKSG